jgi:hypothetical protein
MTKITGCRYSSRCAHAIEGLCDRESPPWRDAADGHGIRCHLDVTRLAMLEGTGRDADAAGVGVDAAAPGPPGEHP